MPDLAGAVLVSATVWPGEHTAVALSAEHGLDPVSVEHAIADLRARALLQRRRGNPSWDGKDCLRASKAGGEACRNTVRGEILDGSIPE